MAVLEVVNLSLLDSLYLLPRMTASLTSQVKRNLVEEDCQQLTTAELVVCLGYTAGIDLHLGYTDGTGEVMRMTGVD